MNTTKRALVITSEGNMDIGAITLMGISTKREDTTKIGMFGTGLKYSIAKLLRDGIPFRVYNGEEEVTFTTRPGKLRGVAYEQIIVNGDTTSITTDMGPQWETWWIVRELLSNARDEQVHEFYTCPWDEVEFKPGWTTFVLDYDTFESVWLNREKFFVSDRAPKWEGGPLKLYTRLGDGTRVYKNGILIMEDDREDAFDYDLADVELNEMREVRYEGFVRTEITGHLLRSLDNAELVRSYVSQMNTHIRYLKNTFTGEVGSFDQMHLTMSDAWKHVIETSDQPFHGKEGLSSDLPSGGIVLPAGVHGVVRAHIAKDRPMVLTDPTKEQDAMLTRCMGTMFDANFKVRFPIKVAELGPHVVGQAINGTIVLNPDKAFKDDATLVCVLLEEAMHLQTGLSDATRAFQTAILKTWAGCILKTNDMRPTPVPAPDVDDFPFG